MAQAHDLVLLALGGFGPGRDLEAVGQAIPANDQGMVAGGRHGLGQAPENALAFMMDGGGFAVHDRARPADLPAEGLSDRLMPKANAQQGDFAGEALDHLQGNARLVGRAGPGGDDDFFRGQPFDLRHRDLVIAHHGKLGSQLPKVLVDVVGERVVVIDEQNHAFASPSPR